MFLSVANRLENSDRYTCQADIRRGLESPRFGCIVQEPSRIPLQ
jgi:hypothetical protein